MVCVGRNVNNPPETKRKFEVISPNSNFSSNKNFSFCETVIKVFPCMENSVLSYGKLFRIVLEARKTESRANTEQLSEIKTFILPLVSPPIPAVSLAAL